MQRVTDEWLCHTWLAPLQTLALGPTFFSIDILQLSALIGLNCNTYVATTPIYNYFGSVISLN